MLSMQTGVEPLLGSASLGRSRSTKMLKNRKKTTRTVQRKQMARAGWRGRISNWHAHWPMRGGTVVSTAVHAVNNPWGSTKDESEETQGTTGMSTCPKGGKLLALLREPRMLRQREQTKRRAQYESTSAGRKKFRSRRAQRLKQAESTKCNKTNRHKAKGKRSPEERKQATTTTPEKSWKRRRRGRRKRGQQKKESETNE